MATESDHPDMPTSIERMLRPERMETLDPFRVLSHCPVNQRDIVADLGCGPGYFALMAFRHVWDMFMPRRLPHFGCRVRPDRASAQAGELRMPTSEA